MAFRSRPWIRGKRLPVLGLAVAVLAAAAPSTEAARARRGRASQERQPAAGAAAWDMEVVRVQVLLDRAHFSPGEIDGRDGSNTREALEAFRQARGLRDLAAVLEVLGTDTAPVLAEYVVTEADVAGPFEPEIPQDMMEKAKLPSLPYTSPLEALAERFHCSPELLRQLNPQATFDRPGTPLVVPRVGDTSPPAAARVVVDRSERAVYALDARGTVLSRYPATLGSRHDPLPVGNWKIRGVSHDPPFRYNPDLFWDAEPDHGQATLPPGPNNPVGVAWIDLSKDRIGIHGTPEPSTVSKTQSHGCIRLTNWDVRELAAMVAPGLPARLQD